MRTYLKWIAYFCLLLIFGSAGLFVVHHHPSGVDDGNCAICVMAQTTTPTSSMPILLATALVVSLLHAVPPMPARQRLIGFALSVRPPPAQ